MLVAERAAWPKSKTTIAHRMSGERFAPEEARKMTAHGRIHAGAQRARQRNWVKRSARPPS
ncbi:MAG: hypothetical protein WKF84_09850 [Pyrinomonadaceae bacterium]